MFMILLLSIDYKHNLTFVFNLLFYFSDITKYNISILIPMNYNIYISMNNKLFLSTYTPYQQ